MSRAGRRRAEPLVARGSRYPARTLGLKARPRPAKARGAAASGEEAGTPGLAVRLDRDVDPPPGDRAPRAARFDPRRSDGNPHFRALDVRDRGLCRAIVGIALRRRGEIEAALAEALDKPLPENSGALAAILHVAAAQILFLDVPDHAAVNLAVEQAAGSHRTGRARGLVNGVLRQLSRGSSTLPQRPAGRLNTPPWLFQRWSNAYGEATAEKIAAAHLELPPLDLSAKGDAAALGRAARR